MAKQLPRGDRSKRLEKAGGRQKAHAALRSRTEAGVPFGVSRLADGFLNCWLAAK